MAGAGKTFRIFVSSTFKDLEEERNALQREVFPKLRDLCTEHGCRFQAVDLRWGVRGEAGLDQRTMRICLEEIKRCQKTTPRPNFIVLLGDRYGWCPLPEEIPKDEFEEIMKHVPAGEDKELLNTWYKRDDNAVPPIYILQPRTGEFVDSEVWEKKVELKLRSVLLEAASKVDLSPERRIKYVASATEQEINNGALTIEDASEHVFCFFRKIVDLPNDERARDFVDLEENGKPDVGARQRLEDLKNRLQEALPGNIYEYEVKWTGKGHTNGHLKQLCEDVYNSLAKVIKQEIEKLKKGDFLEEEISEQENFRQERTQFFIGRANILEKISKYIKEEGQYPLAIFGEGGSGKSSLIAYAIEQARQKFPGAEIVFRFIGTTPSSSDGRALLESLCREISRLYGGDEATVPSSYEELIKDFRERLSLATAEKPLILFLDSLDQLSTVYNAQNLIWLPGKLPENVRLITTTRPGEQLVILRGKLPEANVVKLEPMPEDEANTLLDLWLEDARRTLQDFQRREILEKFKACGLPLYLKLAFEEARLWSSDFKDVKLNPTIKGIIRELYERLSSEANHGKMLVSRSLGYLAATRVMNGLSEDELIDVLSLDKEVFDDFTKRAQHQPPEERLPVVIWSRLYYDLEPYLSERSAEGATLLTFYHRELGEVAREEYLKDTEEKKRHHLLANYFRQTADPKGDGSWSGVPRALAELPYHQAMAELWDEVFKTLTDFRFLENKTERVGVMEYRDAEGKSVQVYSGVFSLQEDYETVLDRFPAQGDI